LACTGNRSSVGSPLGYTFGYDPDDRLTAQTLPSGESRTDGYDKSHALTGVTSSIPAHNESYTFERNGNQLSFVIGPDNRLRDDGTYTYDYDNEGNHIRAHHHRTQRLPPALERTSRAVRRRLQAHATLATRYRLIGASAIRAELQALGIDPLPAARTVSASSSATA
jgi:YD repeat-containing protein